MVFACLSALVVVLRAATMAGPWRVCAGSITTHTFMLRLHIVFFFSSTLQRHKVILSASSSKQVNSIVATCSVRIPSPSVRTIVQVMFCNLVGHIWLRLMRRALPSLVYRNRGQYECPHAKHHAYWSRRQSEQAGVCVHSWFQDAVHDITRHVEGTSHQSGLDGGWGWCSLAQ